MLKRALLFTTVLFTFYMSACNSSIKPEELYGKWKYIKVEHPNANPPDSLRKEELQARSPYILFQQGNKFTIIWDGKALSQGTFSTIGQSIMIKEAMPGAAVREFSFLVTKLTDKDLIFETKGDDGSRVTAVKF